MPPLLLSSKLRGNKEMLECSCARFDRLSGAGTKAYIADFLERAGTDEKHRLAYFRCRSCGTHWKQSDQGGGRHLSLIKLSPTENV